MDILIFEGMSENVICGLIESRNDDLIKKYKLFRKKWVENKMCECKFDDQHTPNCVHIKKQIKKQFETERNFIWNLTVLQTKQLDADSQFGNGVFDRLFV